MEYENESMPTVLPLHAPMQMNPIAYKIKSLSPGCRCDIKASCVPAPCPQCGASTRVTAENQHQHDHVVAIHSSSPASITSDSKSSSTNFILIGYLCGALSLLIFPPALGLAGFICGLINLTKGQVGHGIAQIVTSVACTFIGMVIGFELMSQMGEYNRQKREQEATRERSDALIELLEKKHGY